MNRPPRRQLLECGAECFKSTALDSKALNGFESPTSLGCAKAVLHTALQTESINNISRPWSPYAASFSVLNVLHDLPSNRFIHRSETRVLLASSRCPNDGHGKLP